MSNLCKNCGGPLKEGATKCVYCGTPVPVQPVAPPQPVAPAEPAQPETQPAQNTPDLAQILAGLAALGVIGSATTTPTPDNGSNGNSGGDTAHRSASVTGFDNKTWKEYWRAEKGKKEKIGLILTNTKGLSRRADFIFAVERYIKARENDEIRYSLLDLATQAVCGLNQISCQEIVKLLKEVYSVAVPDYLLIVGDHSVIPCISWANEAGDRDKTVPSDLPYITLDTDSPWSGKKYDFNGITQVGRIPTSISTEFVEVKCYFGNVEKYKPYKEAKTFAYSAYVWAQTSAAAHSSLNPTLITSPLYTCNTDMVSKYGLQILPILEDKFNLLCFNLHGSDATHTWYGEATTAPGLFKKGQRFIVEAFDSLHLPANSKGYVVCTEACYGARPAVSKNEEKGIVVDALTNNCIAFVGSTRIAYGASGGFLCSADIIAAEFSTCVAKGVTVGESLLRSFTRLCKNRMNETTIKTLAEFALYGDPSLVLVESQAAKTFSTAKHTGISKTQNDSSMAFRLVSCDDDMGMRNFSTVERAKLDKIVNNIRNSGNQYMMSNFSTKSPTEPKIFKLMGKGGYRAIYTERDGGVDHIVRVHMDDDGNVETVYISK